MFEDTWEGVKICLRVSSLLLSSSSTGRNWEKSRPTSTEDAPLITYRIISRKHLCIVVGPLHEACEFLLVETLLQSGCQEVNNHLLELVESVLADFDNTVEERPNGIGISDIIFAATMLISKVTLLLQQQSRNFYIMVGKRTERWIVCHTE